MPPLFRRPFHRKRKGYRTSCSGWLQAVQEPLGTSSRCPAAGPQVSSEQEQGSRAAGSQAAGAGRALSMPPPAALQVEASSAAGRGAARRASATLLDVEFPDEPTLRQRVDPVT